MNLRDRVHAFLHPHARAHTAQPIRHDFSQAAAAERGLRRGMWVKIDSSNTGILMSVRIDGTSDVQLVEADGTNRMTLAKMPNGEQRLVPLLMTVETASLKQALLQDIPEARRPPPHIAAGFGYRSKGGG